MPDEIERLTPTESQAVLAGGEQRSLNRMLANRAVRMNAIAPVGLVGEPSKFQTPKFDQFVQERADLIKTRTDAQFRKELEHKKSQQDLFGQMFITSNHGRKEGTK